MSDHFRQLAHTVSRTMGSSWAFVGALLIVAIWAASGPLFHFSDTWQLVINTGTTIVTFLMVFLIQNTQNRDAQALHLKLDELIRVVEGARQELFVDLEDKSDAEIERVRQEILVDCDVCQSPDEHDRHLKATQPSSATPAGGVLPPPER